MIIGKQEYKAKKWSFNTLTPYSKIKEAVQNGAQTVWDLADFFDVSAEFMANSLIYYTKKYGYIDY